jgi:hypothetical protein
MRRASFFSSGRAAIESSGQTVSCVVYTIPAWKSRKFLARPELRLVNLQVFPRRRIQQTDESRLCHFAQRAGGEDTTATENSERIAAANRVQMTADCYDSNCPRSEKI